MQQCRVILYSPHRRVPDHSGICVGVIVNEDVEALSSQIPHDIEESCVDGVVGDIVIADSAHSISCGWSHLSQSLSREAQFPSSAFKA